MKKCCFFMLFLCSFATTTYCQELSKTVIDRKKPTTFVQMFSDDLEYMLKTPTRITPSDALTFAGFAAVTTGMMFTLDQPVHNQFRTDSAYVPSEGVNLLTAPGRLYDMIDPHLFILGTTGLMVGVGELIDNRKMSVTGFAALEAVFFSAMTTNFIKFAAGRERPLVTGYNKNFNPMDISEGNLRRSFPSGHTTKAFAFATVIASSYDSPWIKIPSYALAGSVALQRVESGSHWISDVFIGGAIGYFVGLSLANRHGLVKNSTGVTPIVKGGQLGLNVKF